MRYAFWICIQWGSRSGKRGHRSQAVCSVLGSACAERSEERGAHLILVQGSVAARALSFLHGTSGASSHFASHSQLLTGVLWTEVMGTLSGSDAHSGFECPPINLIYSHYHNAVRAELDRLSENASELEKVSAGKVGDRLIALRTQCRFLEKIYKYHSSVEDEVCKADHTPGLTTYSLVVLTRHRTMLLDVAFKVQ